MILVLIFFAFGCVSDDDVNTDQTDDIQNINGTGTLNKSISVDDEEVVEKPTTSNDKDHVNVPDGLKKIENSTKDFLKSEGYEADVEIKDNNMEVYFDATNMEKTDVRSMIDECVNIMKNYLPSEDVYVLFYDNNNQKIAFERYINSDRTITYLYDYTKYPDVKKSAEKLFKSYGYDADVEVSQSGMLVYFHTKGVTDSNLHLMSEQCVRIMMDSLPDQNTLVCFYDDNDQLIADGYYLDWLDKIDIMVY